MGHPMRIEHTYIFYPTPPPQAGCEKKKKTIFKRGKAGLYSEFFLLLDWLSNEDKTTQSVLLFTRCWGEMVWIHTFAKVIKAKEKL